MIKNTKIENMISEKNLVFDPHRWQSIFEHPDRYTVHNLHILKSVTRGLTFVEILSLRCSTAGYWLCDEGILEKGALGGLHVVERRLLH
ncbi:hypothetical protein TNCV_99241 [Trichonephila clavipes]|nr:hypothetical protein TNCV_99241 [Trichonephila clavipes]